VSLVLSYSKLINTHISTSVFLLFGARRVEHATTVTKPQILQTLSPYQMHSVYLPCLTRWRHLTGVLPRKLVKSRGGYSFLVPPECFNFPTYKSRGVLNDGPRTTANYAITEYLPQSHQTYTCRISVAESCWETLYHLSVSSAKNGRRILFKYFAILT
jgi:hypothetical protein